MVGAVAVCVCMRPDRRVDRIHGRKVKMVLKTKLLGTGTDSDPYRVALPTYQLVVGHIDKGYALVNVNEDDIGLTDEALKHENPQKTVDGMFYETLCDDCLAAAHRHMDKRYQEHKGKFRIENV